MFNAQGIIDNGGYRYFFESDWPDKPNYEVFAEAYEKVGCSSQADDMRRVVASFGFAEPHLHVDFRNAFIGEHYDPETFEVPAWGDALCGDDTVFEALRAYAHTHAAAFDLG